MRWIEKSQKAKKHHRALKNVFIPLYTNMSSPAHQNFMYITTKCTTTLLLLLLQLPFRLIDINASLILPYLSIPTT